MSLEPVYETPSFSADVFNDNQKFPVNMWVWIPCAGEYAVLSGDLHYVYHTTLDGNGGFHMKYHYQPMGLSGYGSVTGDKYQGTGVTQDQFNGTVGFEETYINNFKIIGQGPGNNYRIH